MAALMFFLMSAAILTCFGFSIGVLTGVTMMVRLERVAARAEAEFDEAHDA